MNIYVIGPKLDELLETKYKIIHISEKFNDFEPGDILIINTKLKIPIMFRKFEKTLSQNNVITINLTDANLRLNVMYKTDSLNLETLLETIVEDNYFETDGVPLRYKYIDKGFNKTLVVLQSSGIKWTDHDMYEKYKSGKISKTEYSKFVTECHRKYVFFKSFEDVNYNLMFVQDNYNAGFGWYLVHENQQIDATIASAISTVLKAKNQLEPESVIFGSSKGAYGAMVVGQHLSTKIVCQYPIYDVMRRYKLNKTDDYKLQYEVLLNQNDRLLREKKTIFKTTINEAIKNCSGRLTVLVGVADDDTSLLLSRFNAYRPDMKLLVNLDLMTHGQYSSTSKGQASAILNGTDLSSFNIQEINVIQK